MKIWQGQCFDHRLGDESTEGSAPEIYTSSRAELVAVFRKLVVEALAPVKDKDDAQYPAVQPETHPVEILLKQIKLAGIPHRDLVLACLNREGWASEFLQHETITINKHGHVIKTRFDVAARSSGPFDEKAQG